MLQLDLGPEDAAGFETPTWSARISLSFFVFVVLVAFVVNWGSAAKRIALS